MHEQPPQPTTTETEAAAAETESAPALRPRIYVASLADYNAGRLHGTWLDASLDPEQLYEATEAMLARSTEPAAEEWAIHDHEDFGGINLGEYLRFETVSRLARGLVQHGEAFAGLVEMLGFADSTEDSFQDRYLGAWTSVEAYAAELMEACDIERHLDQLPKPLRRYVHIDSSSLARDMELGGEIHTKIGVEGVHVFHTG